MKSKAYKINKYLKEEEEGCSYSKEIKEENDHKHKK